MGYEKRNRLVLAIDPSGNFNEGKGTTGWAIINGDRKVIACGQILANNFDNKFDYWSSVIELFNFKFDCVVIEDYILYESKSRSQINSRFETPKLIGILELYCHNNNIEYALQKAVEVKKRWTDEILVLNNIIQYNKNRYFASGVQISEHIRDAIRHGVHYITYKLKEDKNENKV